MDSSEFGKFVELHAMALREYPDDVAEVRVEYTTPYGRDRYWVCVSHSEPLLVSYGCDYLSYDAKFTPYPVVVGVAENVRSYLGGAVGWRRVSFIKERLCDWCKRPYRRWEYNSVPEIGRHALDNHDRKEIVERFYRVVGRMGLCRTCAYELVKERAWLLIRRARRHIYLREPWKQRDTRQQSVYLMSIPERRQYKIGRSVNPESRRAALQTGSAEPVELVCHAEVDDAVGVERMLHEQYASKRLEGEWFGLSLGDVEDICSSIEGAANGLG